MIRKFKGSPGKRYYLVNCGKSRAEIGKPSVGRVGIIEGIPNPASPYDPSKDIKTGKPIAIGDNYAGSLFWAAVLAADIVWTERGYRRYFEYSPSMAERIRAPISTDG
jgi:hypothetical protein